MSRISLPNQGQEFLRQRINKTDQDLKSLEVFIKQSQYMDASKFFYVNFMLQKLCEELLSPEKSDEFYKKYSPLAQEAFTEQMKAIFEGQAPENSEENQEVTASSEEKQ